MSPETYGSSSLSERRDYQRRSAERRNATSERRDDQRTNEPERRCGYDRRIIETRRYE